MCDGQKRRRGRVDMYRTFAARNIRCIGELKFQDLARINLIAGTNGVGKTTLLEALFLHCGAYNPELALRVNAFRGIEAIEIKPAAFGGTPWDSLFRNFDSTSTVELVGEDDVSGWRRVKLSVVRDPRGLAEVGELLVTSGQTAQAGSYLSSATAQVLRLETSVNRRKKLKHYLIVDHSGIHRVPMPPPPPFPAHFLSDRVRIPPIEEADRFGKVDLMGKQELLVQALRVVEPRLRRLATIVVGGVPTVHGELEGVPRLVPLPIMGDGLVRLARYLATIANCQSGVVLIDEVENGLHYSILRKVWRAIGEVAREFNAQIFATTHSRECIRAAHEAFCEFGRYEFRLFRLERNEEEVRAVGYDKDTLEAALEMGLEVR